MPFEHENKIMVVTKDELVPRFYSWKNLEQIIQRHKAKNYGIKKVTSGGNGRQLLIAFDSLPKEIQDMLGDPRKGAHVLEKFYRVDGEAVIFFRDYRFEDGTALNLKYQEKYVMNANMLKALWALKFDRETIRMSMGSSSKGILTTLCNDAMSFRRVLQSKYNVQHTLPENQRRFNDALADFDKKGYDSLISGKHKNDNSRKVTDEAMQLLNNMFGRGEGKPTAVEIHRRYNAFKHGFLEVINQNTGEVYNADDFKALSASTVTNYLLNWQNSIGTFSARSGDRQKLMAKFKPHHSLKKSEFAGSLISIDDRQPPFKAENGKRVWFYNGIDTASDAFTCWVHGETKEGLIIDFYRQLIRNYHEWGLSLPNELEAEMSLNSQFVNTFLKPGNMFAEVRIEANNARGKRIERYYGSLRYGIEKKREEWLARPFALSESNQAGQGEVKKLPFATIIDNGLEDIETWNNMPHCSGNGQSRWEYFLSNQHPDLPETNYLGILPYLGFKTETSCNVGIIRFQHREWLLGNEGDIALGEKLINLMKQAEGQDLDIYWIDGNDGKIIRAVVFIGTQYICDAVPKPIYHRAKLEQGPDDYAARELMSAYVATIESYRKKKYHSLEPLTIIDHTPAPAKTFKIAGLKNRTISDTPAEQLQSFEDLDHTDFDNESQQTFYTPLKDRF